MTEKDLVYSWKNSEVFKKQLQFNLKELPSINNYPLHWNISLHILKNAGTKSLLDIGCGCGSFYKVCKDNLPEVKYCGCDYSKDAIILAEETWTDGCFFVEDIMNLSAEDVKDYDTLYASALMDVSPNGDGMVDKMLSLNANRILLSRVKMTNQDSYYVEYKAYEEIETCAYHHNASNLIDIFSKHDYNYQIISDHIYLEKK